MVLDNFYYFGSLLCASYAFDMSAAPGMIGFLDDGMLLSLDRRGIDRIGTDSQYCEQTL